MTSVIDTAAQLKKMSNREVALALGWALNGNRDAILEACEDALEDWNHHEDCAKVCEIRTGKRPWILRQV